MASLDTSDKITSNNEIQKTLSLTLAAGATSLAVGIFQISTTNPLTITWNGTSLGSPYQTVTVGSDRLLIYGLVAPATGTHDLVVTWAGATYAQVVAMSVTHGDPATAFDFGATSSAVGNQSLTTTSAAGDLVFFMLGHHPNDNNQTADAGQTVLPNGTSTNGNITAIGSTVPGATSVTATYTFGSANQGMMAAASFKANATPVITSTSPDPVAEGATMTITGVNLKASGNSTVTLNGTSQTVTTQSATVPQITVALGTALFGTALDLILTDSAAVASNTYSIPLGITPPSGYNYVTIGTPDATADNRITAVNDIASGNQLEWDNAANVTIDSTGAFNVADGVSTFNVRVGVSGSGWGAWAAQTVNASPTPGRTQAGSSFIAGVGTLMQR